MAKISYKNAGVIKDIQQPYAKVGNIWVPAKMVLTKIAGVWEEVWPGTKTYVHEGDGFDLNIFQLFGSPKDKAHYIFVNNGRIGGSPAPGTGYLYQQVVNDPNHSLNALTTGMFPAGSRLTILNNGYIAGRGGGGGGAYIYTNDSGGWAAFPSSGGNAILLQHPTTIVNEGQIFAGGGGGGSALVDTGNGWVNRCGGAGAGFSPGFYARSYDGYRGLWTYGQPATITSGSIGDGNLAGGYGGNGGGIAQAGTTGYSPSSGRFWAEFNYGRGWCEGAGPGNAIVGSANIVEFTVGNTPDRVKGAISA